MNRALATLALLAWYACVAVVGPGLHEVLGCEHHHHHGAAAVATQSGPVGALAIGRQHDGSDNDGDDDDGCPLCKLLSMAQTCAVVVRPIWVANVLPHRVSFSFRSIAAAPRSLWQIRGPPLAQATA
jgi:Protein of unknown function (DUF2946)